MRKLALFVAACVSLACAPAALADSIVYEKDGNVWEATPDGGNQRQVTTSGGYAKPTQADDGTIVAVKDQRLHRMDRAGRVLNTAGQAGSGAGTGPFTPQLNPVGSLVAYDYNSFLVGAPGLHTAVSHATRETGHNEIFQISGWINAVWFGNDRLMMFDGSPNDTLIKVIGGGNTQTWFEDPDLALTGGDVSPNHTRFAGVAGTKMRLYNLSGSPPDGMPQFPACELTASAGTFFRPSWSPDGSAIAWQEDDGVWAMTGVGIGATCQGDGRLIIPGGKAPDWGPANVSPPVSPGGGQNVADTIAPALKASAARRVRRKALLRGLSVKVTCNEPCRVTADLLLDRRTAKRLRLAAAKPVRIGRASKRLARAGTVKLTLRPTAKARKRLRRGRLSSVTVRTQATDAAGNRSKAVTRKVRIRG